MNRIVRVGALSLFIVIISSFSITHALPMQPSPTSHSSLWEYLLSPNHSVDVLYMNGQEAPVLVSDFHLMPLHPDTKEKLRQEGKLQEVADRLDNLKKQRELEGLGVDQPFAGKVSIKAGSLSVSAVTGNQKALVLFVDFSDKTSRTNANSFYNLFFGTGSSMRDFYRVASYNKVFIEGTVAGFYRAPTTYAYYVNASNGLGSYPRNAQKLVEDAVTLANPFINFAPYDVDGDGYVDCLFVVHAGPGAEYTGSVNDIWSHAWGITSKLVDGVYVSSYSMEPEYWASPGDMTIGVYCHELGHVFGLPDFYDTDNSSEGLGNWSLMAGGSWNGNNGNQPSYPDAWCKIRLGWVTPIVPTTNIMGASIPASATTSVVYKLWANGTTAKEYYLVENRQKLAYDSRIPASGLAIYHVDDNKSNNTKEWYSGYTTNGHYWVAFEQADNLWGLEKGTNRGDGGDIWPGTSTRRTFDANSTPSSKAYSGAFSKVGIKNISNSGSPMTADIYVTDTVPVELSSFWAQ